MTEIEYHIRKQGTRMTHSVVYSLDEARRIKSDCEQRFICNYEINRKTVSNEIVD